MKCSPEEGSHCYQQPQAETGKRICRGNISMQRAPRFGNTDSGTAELVALGDPPQTHQTPHRGHMGAERDKSDDKLQ